MEAVLRKKHLAKTFIAYNCDLISTTVHILLKFQCVGSTSDIKNVSICVQKRKFGGNRDTTVHLCTRSAARVNLTTNHTKSTWTKIGNDV